MIKNKNIGQIFMQKAELYSLLSLIFSLEPSEDFCKILYKQVFSEDYIPLGDYSNEIREKYNFIRQKMKKESIEDFYNNFYKDYYYIFFNPKKMLASPWQSSYFNDGSLLFQEPNLICKKFYKKYKLDNNSNFPYDHIGLEINFLENLSYMENNCHNDSIYISEIVKDNILFVDNMIEWVPLLHKRILTYIDNSYYVDFLELLMILLVFDENTLKEFYDVEI
ncbi:MAG: molecular chaperone TorD family protein [Finegoldia sp.]|nr:molecular chaperone TorD family protein [Finegoldia sp.]